MSGQLLVFDLAHAGEADAEEVDRRRQDGVRSGVHARRQVRLGAGEETNEIAVIDTATWKVVARITDAAFKQPHQVVFSADGRTAFVTNNNKMDHMADPAHAGHAMPGDGTASLVVIDVEDADGRASRCRSGKNLTGMGTRAR